MVDLSLYREPEEAKEEENETAVADYKDYGAGVIGMDDQWSSHIPDAQWGGDVEQLPIVGAPVAAAGWSGADGSIGLILNFEFFELMLKHTRSVSCMLHFCLRNNY